MAIGVGIYEIPTPINQRPLRLGNSLFPGSLGFPRGTGGHCELLLYAMKLLNVAILMISCPTRCWVLEPSGMSRK